MSDSQTETDRQKEMVRLRECMFFAPRKMGFAMLFDNTGYDKKKCLKQQQ